MPRPDPPKIDHPYVFSVSQIENFLLCPRKWAFDKIDGIEEPETAAQALGTAVHDALENYLDKGIPLDTDTKVGQIAMAGHKHLPLPKTEGMRVERWFSIQFGVAAYRGLKDVEIIKPGRIPYIIDHKTTKNFKWQKSEKELLNDIQAGIYAADAIHKTQSNVAHLKWIYYRTEGSRASAITPVKMTKAQVEPILYRVDETAKKMIHMLKTVNSAMDAEPNFLSCDAFGGCPHKHVRCKVTPSGALKSLMRQKMAEESRENRFLSQLRKAAGSSNGKSKEPVEVQGAEVSVNAPEASQEKNKGVPPPPSARKIGDEWVQPVWDDETGEWGWPPESIDAIKSTVEKGRERVQAQKQSAIERFRERKKEKTKSSSKTTSSKAAPKAAPKAASKTEQKTEPKTESKTAPKETRVASKPDAEKAALEAWDTLLDRLADLVAEKLKNR